MPLAGLVVNRASPRAGRTAVGRARRWPRPSGCDERRPDVARPPGCSGCTPTGSGSSSARRGCASGSPPAHPEVPTAVVPALATRRARPRRPAPDRRRCSRRRPADPTADPAGGRGQCRRQRGVGADDRGRRARLAGRLEQATPRGDVRAAAQQRTALTLGHAAPDAPLDLVVERLGEALGAHRAARAHLLGPVLRGTAHEQLVRSRLVAQQP